MNTPRTRAAGSAVRLAASKSSGLKLALLGGAAAVAMAVTGIVTLGMSEPDPTETAAVPPRVDLPAGMSTASGEATTTARQARSLAAQIPAPLASDTARLQAPATTATADAPTGQPPAGPEQRETIAAAQAAPQPAITTPDTTGTASIPVDEPHGSADVQVAETEAEIAKLEAATGMTEEPTAGTEASQPAQAAPAETKLAAVSHPDLKPATVTKHVNLRDGPADEAEVITVVPANAAIEAEADCGWCTVVYKGQRGYIYKSFINRSTAAAEGAADGQGLY